jgi:hypothetical protein
MIFFTYWFMGLAMIFLAVYFSIIASSKTRKYFKKSKKLSELEDEHEKMRLHLKELKVILIYMKK